MLYRCHWANTVSIGHLWILKAYICVCMCVCMQVYNCLASITYRMFHLRVLCMRIQVLQRRLHGLASLRIRNLASRRHMARIAPIPKRACFPSPRNSRNRPNLSSPDSWSIRVLDESLLARVFAMPILPNLLSHLKLSPAYRIQSASLTPPRWD